MPERTGGTGRRGTAVLAHGLLPLLIVVVGYATVVDDFFLSDDFSLLANALHAARWTDATSLSPRWNRQFHRPLPLASWWVCAQAFGLAPLGHHLVNVGLHALNACLLARLLAPLGPGLWGGAVAGAAFAAAPFHAEAVTWISGRFDVACATGVLVALLAWSRWLDGAGRGTLVAGGLGLVVAATCKAPGFLVVAYLPLLAFARARLDARAWRGWGLLAALGTVLLAWRWSEVGGLGGVATQGGVRNRLLAFDVPQIAKYARQAFATCFLPVPRASGLGLAHPWRLLPALAWGGALVVTLASPGRRRTARSATALLAAFAISLCPMATWAHVGARFQATRFLYVPSVFSAAILGSLFAFADGRRTRIAALVLAAGAVGSWTHQLRAENRTWSEAATLAEHVLRTFPAGELRGRTALVADLPATHGGAVVFHGSFAAAVTTFVDPAARVHEVPDTWNGRSTGRGRVLLRWSPGEGRWEVPSSRKR